jgi:hypothetical protein
MDSYVPTAVAGEWVCVSPKYRGMGLMSELMSRISKLRNSQFPFVMDMPNKASMNGFQKALYYEMALKFLVRPLRLSKCFVYKKLPRMLLRPFDAVWVKIRWTERVDISNKFTVKEYCLPTFDDRFDRLFNATNEIGIIKQVRNSVSLNWRYKNVPGREYKTIVCYGENGTLDGYIVLRLTIAYGIKVGFILDLVSKNDLEIGKSLISWALGYFWRNDAAIAAALCFPERKEYEMLKRESFFVCPQRIRPNPFILYIKRVYEKYNQYDVKILTDSNRWQFMFGDYQVF